MASPLLPAELKTLLGEVAMLKKLVFVSLLVIVSLVPVNLFAGGGESVFQTLFASAAALLNLNDDECFVWIDGTVSCESAVPEHGPASPNTNRIDGSSKCDPKEPKQTGGYTVDYFFGTQIIPDEG
jgi:hypothetical protein